MKTQTYLFKSNSRFIEIGDLAEEIAQEYYPSNKVDPLEIASKKRISSSFGHYGNAFDGMLEWKKHRFHIYCNLDRVSKSTSTRAMFTIAHELGHFFIDEHRVALISGNSPPHPLACEYQSTILSEREADHFAANLLMPKERFIYEGKGAPLGIAGMVQLASNFNTSLISTAIRYVSLDIRPCVIIKWNWKSYAWKYLSPSFYRARFRKTIENPNAILEGSATYRVLKGEKCAEHQFLKSASVASAWFQGVYPGKWRDIILTEEAISLGKYGVLTFLRPAEPLNPFIKED